MKDSIIQQVRTARTEVASDFDYDLHKFFAWAKSHAVAEKKAKHQLPTNPNAKASTVRTKKTTLKSRSRKSTSHASA